MIVKSLLWIYLESCVVGWWRWICVSWVLKELQWIKCLSVSDRASKSAASFLLKFVLHHSIWAEKGITHYLLQLIETTVFCAAQPFSNLSRNVMLQWYYTQYLQSIFILCLCLHCALEPVFSALQGGSFLSYTSTSSVVIGHIMVQQWTHPKEIMFDFKVLQQHSNVSYR